MLRVHVIRQARTRTCTHPAIISKQQCLEMIREGLEKEGERAG